jgi:hypothetical protein
MRLKFATIVSVPFLAAIVFLSLCHTNEGFNVDTKHSQVHRRAPNSGFGYSVDFAYRDQRRDKFRSVNFSLKTIMFDI